MVAVHPRFSANLRFYGLISAWCLTLASACTGLVVGEPAVGGDDGQGGGGGGNGPPGREPFEDPEGGAGGCGGGGVPGGPAMLAPGQPKNDGIVGDMRRLTKDEYRNTAVDLLGLAGFNLAPTDSFLPDGRSGLFVNNVNLPTGTAIAFDYLTAAESFADERVRYNFGVLSTCAFDKTEEPCAREFIERVGRRTFRRPLSQVERDDFYGLFRSVRTATGGTYQDGVRVVLTALLQSQEFLYHFEVGDVAQSQAATSAKVPLTDYELASRLSYMFWSSMPDDELFRAAGAGELETVSGLMKQVDRMLAMPRTRKGIMKFFREWLNFESSVDIYNNPLYGAARDFLGQEVEAFIASVVFEGDGKVATLLTAPYSFINAPLAAIYGIDGVVGNELRKQALDPAQRSGILTMPIFMANTAFPDGGIRPVMRGKYVRERLLCQELPPPPPEANTMAPVVQDGASVRQRFVQHAADPFCAGCHRLLDPLGLVFNRYEATGAYQKLDPNKPGPDGNDDEGQILATDVDGKIAGVRQLAQKLAASRNVQACVATSWFRYALGRSGEDEHDEEPLAELVKKFSESGGDIRLLFKALVQSDAFRFKTAPAKEACK